MASKRASNIFLKLSSLLSTVGVEEPDCELSLALPLLVPASPHAADPRDCSRLSGVWSAASNHNITPQHTLVVGYWLSPCIA